MTLSADAASTVPLDPSAVWKEHDMSMSAMMAMTAVMREAFITVKNLANDGRLVKRPFLRRGVFNEPVNLPDLLGYLILPLPIRFGYNGESR